MARRSSSNRAVRRRARRTGDLARATLLLGFGLASASVSAAADPAACRTIDAPMERLDCYDRAVDASRLAAPGSERGESSAAAVAREAMRDDAPVAETASTPARGAPRAAQTAHEAATRTHAAVPGTVPATVPATVPTTVPTPADARTRIAEVRQTTIGRQRYVLENGEVWEQAELRSGSALSAGDQVIVQETMFGGHRLRTADGRGPSVRVRSPQ